MKSKWYKHDVDRAGFPTDPELRHLETFLAILATAWRDSRNEPAQSEKLIVEYHEALLRLYELGWDTDLHPEAQLSDEFMPEEWFEHNPDYREFPTT